MLQISDLHVSAPGVQILNGVNLVVNPGEVHAIMGPNGSGKSTLANILAGNPTYTALKGSITFDGTDLLSLEPEERARAGIFLSFQHPIEIPGVRLDHFLRAGLNETLKSKGKPEIDVLKFDRLIKATVEMVEMDPNLTKRAVNEGFSGGEKKRNEILQMAVLEPKLAILDEIDSGLDVDSLREVADTVNRLRSPETSTILVTHYQRILDHVIPDYVHVLIDGQVAMSGGKDLAKQIESKGYEWVTGNAEHRPNQRTKKRGSRRT